MGEVSKKLVREIRRDAKNRCGYCLCEQQYIFTWLEIEHLHPRAKGGKTVRENLWLACLFCNTYKSAQMHGVDPKTKRKVQLFNPRQQDWKTHFTFAFDHATILGKTVCGRATVSALQLNHELALTTRKLWVSVGWYPPQN